MPSLKDIFVFLLVFYIYPGECDEYLQAGQDVALKCLVPPKIDMVWKLNNTLIITIDGKRGTSRKGVAFRPTKHYISGDTLKITRLEARDSGVYSCGGKENYVNVVSVFADPGTVLPQSSDVTLRCDGANTNPIQWLRPPNGERHESKQEIILKSVTSKDEGQWTCLVQDLKINIALTVVGLQTQEHIEVPAGGDIVLPCSLPKITSRRVVGGKWTAEHLQDLEVSFGTTDDGHYLHWKGQNTSKTVFTSGQLSTNYDINLIKVQYTDAGEFVCTVEFDGGTKLTASTMLKVLPGASGGKVVNNVKGQTPSEGPWTKDVYGVQLWVWIAVGASSVVLIGLIISTVLVQQRNKRMKKRVRKLRSMRQPLTARDYCQCNRSHKEVELTKEVRPVPIPRQQRNAHNRSNQYN